MSLRAGVIGAGAFGRHHARKYAEDPRAELVGVFDLDDERAEMLAKTHKVRAFESAEALIDAIDVLTIASPPSTHGNTALAALAARKHVLVEKPLATDLDAAEEMVRLAEAQHLVLACGHQERLVFEAMGLLAAPERPTLIESVREGPWTGRSADVSVTLDLMVHDLDLALRLLGDAHGDVSAKGQAIHGASADRIEADIRFGAMRACLVSSRVADTRKRTMRAVYPSGEVRINFLTHEFENTTGFALNSGFAETPEARDALGANVARFLDAVAGERPRPVVNGPEALAVLKLALDVDRASGLPSLS